MNQYPSCQLNRNNSAGYNYFGSRQKFDPLEDVAETGLLRVFYQADIQRE